MSRTVLFAVVIGAAVTAAAVRGQRQRPERPMQVERVKQDLYVLRGPFNKCAPNGCGAYADDGFLHEAGDVAVRVTPEVMDYANGASASEWVEVLDKLLLLDFDVVIPGHGALLTKERVRSDRQKLITMNERMLALVKEHVPLEQVFARLRLADLGWDRTVSTVAFKGGLKGYYEEMEQLAKRGGA